MRCVKKCTRSGPAARARREHDLVAEVEARPVPLGLDPRRPAPRAVDPRHRRVVALRDAAELEHVRRAVRAGVGAVGAELDAAAGLVDVQPVARAEPDELLLRMPGQDEPDRGARPSGALDGDQLVVPRRELLDHRRRTSPSTGSSSVSGAITPSVSWMN